jgi:uncharacterized RmlC-like cupin family protein
MRKGSIWILAAIAAGAVVAQTPVGETVDMPRVKAHVATEQPHKKSELHEHKTNRVMVYLSDGEQTYTSADGKANRFTFKKGDVRWDPMAGPHYSENTGDKPFQMLEVELKDKPKTPQPAISKLDPLKIDPKHYSLVLDNPQTRVLRVKFGPKEKGLEHEHTYENLVVYLNDQARGKMGEFRIDGPRVHSEENPLDHPVERISIDIK